MKKAILVIVPLIIGTLIVLCMGMKSDFAGRTGNYNASMCEYRNALYVCIVDTRTGGYRVERWEK